MGDGARSDKLHVGGEGDISGELLPDELEGVGSRPHIRAASRDAELAACAVELYGVFLGRFPDVAARFEYAEVGGARSRRDTTNDQDPQCASSHDFLAQNMNFSASWSRMGSRCNCTWGSR